MNLSNFSERLSELMFDENLKTRSFCNTIGCSHSTLERYLAGTSYPTVENAVKLADYFHCSVDFILGLETENKSNNFLPCPPFGKRLLALCKEFNVTRAQLRKKTDIPESVMRYWVKGITNPSIINVLKIAEYFDRSVDYILGREK